MSRHLRCELEEMEKMLRGVETAKQRLTANGPGSAYIDA